MFRQLPKTLNYKPVTEEQYERLIIPLKTMGVTIMRGVEAERHLDLRGAEAVTLGKDIVFFRPEVSVSAILEETYHIRQNRQELNDDKDFELREILNEIDAKKYLLKVAKKYKIPRKEIALTKLQLEDYRKALVDYCRRKGVPYIDEEGN